jgi:glycosyltransferase involved in cell wall biosynthesis
MLAGIFATKAGDDGEPQPGCAALMGLLEVLPAGTALEQGRRLAECLAERSVDGLHAYFAHVPAAVAEQAAEHLAVPFGFSVHAKDARKVQRPELVARAARAACVIACNHDVADELQAAGAPAHLVPHGVDLRRFTPAPPYDGRTLRLLAVGRLVEKKGFDVLIAALSRLTAEWTLRLVGDGPEKGRLAAQVRTAGLAGRVTFVGACTHAELPAEYALADVVVVPSVVDSSGDRDGLPNVVLEAMASGRPVVGTSVGAIDAAVIDGETGLLVAPRSADALARALWLLAADPARRRTMGERARAHVARHYDLTRCADRFARLIGAAYA